MSGYVGWSASGHRQRAEELAGGPEAFLEGARRMVAEAQVAERMGVSKGRISQIESGQVSGTDVVARYVEALGGNLVLMAVFDDGELRKVG